MLEFGLQDDAKNIILDIFKAYPQIEEVILFGSRALNTFKATSDIDIAIKGKGTNTILAALIDDFEESDLIYEVDVVDYDSITSEKLLEHIDKFGKLLYRKGWVETSLGEVIDIYSGKTRPKVQGAFPVYGGNGILNYGDKFNQEDETIIVGRVGAYCGNVFYETQPFWLSDNALGVKAKETSQEKFLYYKLVSMKLNNHAIGGAQPLLTQTLLKELEINLPPLPEQKAIADMLSSFDEKIELLREQNKTLETLAQTIFKEWFVNFNFPDQQGKPYRHNGGAMVESELGEIPKGWRVDSIKNLPITISDYVANGSFASLKENVTLYDDKEEYALFVRNTDLKSGFKQKIYVDEHSYNFLHKTKLFGGEVIISNVGDVGSVYQCPHLAIPMTLGNNVIMLKSAFNNFLYLLFSGYVGQYLLKGITGGSAQPKFNKTEFRSLQIIAPSEDILGEFEKVSQTIFDKITNNTSQIQTLSKTRDTLLPKLMSGQVRVLNIEGEEKHG